MCDLCMYVCMYANDSFGFFCYDSTDMSSYSYVLITFFTPTLYLPSTLIIQQQFNDVYYPNRYTGNWGIVVGFLSCGVAVLSLLVIITDNGHHGPFLEKEARRGGVGTGRRRLSGLHAHGHSHGHAHGNITDARDSQQSSGEADDASEYSSMHTAEDTRKASKLRVDTGKGGSGKSRRDDEKRGKSKSSRKREGGDGSGNFLGNWLENVKNSATGAMSPRRHRSNRPRRDRSERRGGSGVRSKSMHRDEKRSKSASRSRSNH
jgi:hypothetical protein